MDFASQLIPALIVLAANLFSGRHESRRYEVVITLFGWTLVVSLPLAFVVDIASNYFTPAALIKPYLYQISGFSLLTVLSRDYEKILWPLVPWNRD